MFITDIRNSFRRYRDLQSSDFDALECAILEIRDYLSDMLTAPFPLFDYKSGTISPICSPLRSELFDYWQWEEL